MFGVVLGKAVDCVAYVATAQRRNPSGQKREKYRLEIYHINNTAILEDIAQRLHEKQRQCRHIRLRAFYMHYLYTLDRRLEARAIAAHDYRLVSRRIQSLGDIKNIGLHAADPRDTLSANKNNLHLFNFRTLFQREATHTQQQKNV